MRCWKFTWLAWTMVVGRIVKKKRSQYRSQVTITRWPQTELALAVLSEDNTRSTFTANRHLVFCIVVRRLRGKIGCNHNRQRGTSLGVNLKERGLQIYNHPSLSALDAPVFSWHDFSVSVTSLADIRNRQIELGLGLDPADRPRVVTLFSLLILFSLLTLKHWLFKGQGE